MQNLGLIKVFGIKEFSLVSGHLYGAMLSRLSWNEALSLKSLASTYEICCMGLNSEEG